MPDVAAELGGCGEYVYLDEVVWFAAEEGQGDGLCKGEVSEVLELFWFGVDREGGRGEADLRIAYPLVATGPHYWVCAPHLGIAGKR